MTGLQSFGSSTVAKSLCMDGRDLVRALNLEPPRVKRMQQIVQKRAVNGRVLQPAKPSTFQEENQVDQEAKTLRIAEPQSGSRRQS